MEKDKNMTYDDSVFMLVNNLELLNGEKYDVAVTGTEYRMLDFWHMLQVEKPIDGILILSDYDMENKDRVKKIFFKHYGSDGAEDINRIAVKILCNNDFQSRVMYYKYYQELKNSFRDKEKKGVTCNKFDEYPIITQMMKNMKKIFLSNRNDEWMKTKYPECQKQTWTMLS